MDPGIGLLNSKSKIQGASRLKGVLPSATWPVGSELKLVWHFPQTRGPTAKDPDHSQLPREERKWNAAEN